MTSDEEKQIREWNSELSGDIQIGLVVTEDERSRTLESFCENFSRFAPKIHIVQEEGEPNEAPAIQVGQALRYHAIPLGTELGPFLEVLSPPDKRTPGIPMTIRNHLQELELPAILRLYVSQQCSFCPVTVRHITPLLVVNELIQLTIIDCSLFPEMAQLHQIQSVPTLLLDDQFRWTGSFRLEELAEIMTNRDPSKLGSSSLERMLKEGNAARLAEMMLDKEEIFPAFLDLLIHNKWPVRLGSMVTMELITNRNPKLAARVTTPLWERFPHVEDPVKGDIIYVLGESGDHKIAPKLEMVLSGEYHVEVKEAAREALEKIENKIAHSA